MPTTPTAQQLRALVESFDWETHSAELREGLTQQYRDLVQTEGARAALEHAGATFDMDDPLLNETMTKYVGSRITQLNRTTQKDVTRALQKALKENDQLGVAELQALVLDTVRERFEDYEAWRALRIARTESAIAYNHGNVLGLAQTGVTTVEVIDGSSDASCDACREVNGAEWSIDRALEEPLEHPGCERSFVAARA
jgi:hypothetical protein